MSEEMSPEGKRNLYTLSLVGLVITLAFGLFMPILPLYASQLGANGLEVGVLMSSFMLTRAISGPYAGALSDKVGRKQIILIGTVIYGICSFLYVLPDTWWGLALIRGIQGSASGFVWPVSEALIIDSVPQARRSRSISIFVIFTNIGMVSGPVTGGMISQIGVSFYGMGLFESYKLPFYFTGVLSFLCVALVFVGAKNVITTGEEHRKNAKDIEIPSDHRKMLNVLYINTFMLGMGMGLAASIAALYANSVLGLSAFYISIIFTIASGTGIAVSYPVSRLADRHSKKRIIVNASIAKSAFMLMIPFAPDPVSYGSCMVARNAGMQAADPPMRGLQADLIPAELRGKLVGYMHAYNNIGAVVGPIIGGLIYDLSGNAVLHFLFFTMFMKGMPFLIAVVLSFMAVALLIIYIDEEKIKKQVSVK